MTDKKQIEKMAEYRRKLIEFRTCMEELEQVYGKETIELLEQDEEIASILTMKDLIHNTKSWRAIMFGDNQNVIATFEEPDRKVSMRHYRLTDNGQLELINDWKVREYNCIARERDMIRDRNLYLVTDGFDTVGVYDYKEGKFLIDMYKIKIKDPDLEEIIALVEYQKPVQKIMTM